MGRQTPRFQPKSYLGFHSFSNNDSNDPMRKFRLEFASFIKQVNSVKFQASTKRSLSICLEVD